MMAVVTYVKGQPGPSVDVDDSHDEDYDDHYILLTRKIEVAEAARAAYSKPLPAGISDIAWNKNLFRYGQRKGWW